MNRHLLIFFLLITNELCFPLPTNAQSVEEKQLMVAMRTIGHQTLLLHGDSTSRVLPVKIAGNNRYEIDFQSAFTFKPVKLVTTIDSIIKTTNLSGSYIVEMQDYATDEIIYSYQVEGEVNADIIPCTTRLPPEARYRLIFTAVDEKSFSALVKQNLTGITFGLVILLCFGVYFQSKRKQAVGIDPNILTIGDYKLDKRNMVLSLGGTETMISSKEVDLLALLHSSANETLTRETILKIVWEDEGNYIGRTLDVFISKLRKKLEADPNVRIINIRGVGYKLIVNNGI